MIGLPVSGWKAAFVVAVVAAAPGVLSATIPAAQLPIGGESSSSSHHVSDEHGAVASESAICSRIGISLMRQGGNAADALVGTTLCVGVVGMYHSGIGGGGFMLFRGPGGDGDDGGSGGDGAARYESIDFRETAPAAAREDMFANRTADSIFGGLSVGVPGEIRGFEHLHGRHGRLPWEAVFRPAIEVARSGFPVTADLVRMMGFVKEELGFNFLETDPSWAADFAPNGTLVGLGDVMRRERYADTLELIAKHGARAFYEGEMARTSVAAARARGGTVTMKDFEDYEVSIREPVSIDFKGFKLTSTGAPSSGAVALSILKTMEGYDPMDGMNISTHRFNEAMRYAYGARSELGDPQFLDSIDAFEAHMLNASTSEYIRSRISDDHTRNVSEYNPKGYYSPENHGTSHIVTADASGMSITLTTTVNLLFGSQIMVPETGIILNDEMNDFSIPGVPNAFDLYPSPSNFIRPRKRPLSSISPIIAEYPRSSSHSSSSSSSYSPSSSSSSSSSAPGSGGSPGGGGGLYVSIGAAGGSRIITATAQALWHVLEHGMTTPEALARPRLHDQLLPDLVTLEPGFDAETEGFLRERGCNVTRVDRFLSSVQAVRRLPNGTFEAAGEPRQASSGGLAF